MSTERDAVLIVEPSEPERRRAAEAIHRAGLSVEGAGDGALALELLRKRSFSALVATMDLPDMPGLDLLKAVRARGTSVPFLVVTSAPSLASAVEAMRLGAVDYLARPVSDDELVQRLAEAMKSAHLVTALAQAKEQAAQLISSVEALEATLAGTHPPSRPRLRSAADADALQGLPEAELTLLSPRERDIARLLALGNTVSGMASSLELSPNTVRNHVKSIFGKLKVHSQVALVSRLSGYSR